MAVLARPSEPVENRLLAALPRNEYERLLPNLQQVSFSLGEVVYEFGGHLDYVFFPTTSIVSLLYTMENGSSAEMGLTGNDGVVGIALFMGGGTMPNRAVVQSAGAAIRLKAKVLQDEFALGGKFQHLLLRYTQALITQISQTAVCNRLHSVEQQLCRWLLLSHDRLKTDELIMTQELIADMLGVRREGVTVAAGHLQDIGAISYVRGAHQDPQPSEAGGNRLRVLPGRQRRVPSVAGIKKLASMLNKSQYRGACHERKN